MKRETLNGIEIAYNRQGQGKVLLLVHGYPLDHRIWNDIVPLLEGTFDLITPDLRGFGASEVLDARYAIADMAGDLVGLLDYLGIEKAAVCGHSMGGYVSLALARKHPGRVSGLGLIASQTFADTPERREGRYQAASEIKENGVRPVAETMSGKLALDQQVQTGVKGLISDQQPAGLAGALQAMAERDDSTPDFATFDFPVVIVHGINDELIPIERAREMKSVLPHANLVELPGVGHMPMLESPEATARALSAIDKV